jgi:hypothetical protein
LLFIKYLAVGIQIHFSENIYLTDNGTRRLCPEREYQMRRYENCLTVLAEVFKNFRVKNNRKVKISMTDVGSLFIISQPPIGYLLLIADKYNI